MLSTEQKQKALRLYRNKTLTIKEVANLCDMSEQWLCRLVAQAIKDGTLKPRDATRSQVHHEKKFTNEQLEPIAVDYYENKLNVAELKEKYGIHPMQIQRMRNLYGCQYGGKVRGGEFRVKPVQQFDKQGNLIAEYANGHQASEETGVCYININYCCNGKRKSAGGFVWKFKESAKTSPITHESNSAD